MYCFCEEIFQRGFHELWTTTNDKLKQGPFDFRTPRTKIKRKPKYEGVRYFDSLLEIKYEDHSEKQHLEN